MASRPGARQQRAKQFISSWRPATGRGLAVGLRLERAAWVQFTGKGASPDFRAIVIA
jgi:hypothetical protein